MTKRQRSLDVDIWVIALVTMAAFSFFAVMGNQLMGYVKDGEKPVILRLLLNAGVQFGIAGLGITVVCAARREKFTQFGLNGRNVLKSVAGAAVCFVPYICYIAASGQYGGYRPLGILIAGDVLKSAFPVNVLGMVLIAIVWGFFEGFNYAVISDKLDERYPSGNRWLSVGAVACAVVGILFHPISITFWGVAEIITTFLAIYGMLMVKRRTGNAWGCVFAFCFLWNAL